MDSHEDLAWPPLSMMASLLLHLSALCSCLLLCEARREAHLLRTRSEGRVRDKGLGYQVVVTQGVLWCDGCEMVFSLRVRHETQPG